MGVQLYAYEQRIIEGEKRGIVFQERDMKSRFKGLCVDSVVFFDKNLSMKEKNCILAEEIWHSIINYGDMLDPMSWLNRQQERKARQKTYEELLPVSKLIEAYRKCCWSIDEICDYCDVTPDFFTGAIRYYGGKYGRSTQEGNYILEFDEAYFHIKNINDD